MIEEESIDINCDVGEGIENEAKLFPMISSCNIACGGHTGDAVSMTATVRLAKKHGVKIGAHPSYPDKENFGRVSLNMTREDLIASVQGQLEDLVVVLENENCKLHHIKPHGALYNDMVKNRQLAKVFLRAVLQYRNEVFLYVPFASQIAEEGLRQGFVVSYEAFADRRYNDDLSLVSRKSNKAIIESKEEALAQVLEMVHSKSVKTLTGAHVKIIANTFCIHSDTFLAFEIVSYLTRQLSKHNIIIKR